MADSSPFIGINPIELKEQWFLDPLEHEIKNTLGLNAKLIHLLDNVEFAYHEGRNQYYSTEILKKIGRVGPRKLYKGHCHYK